MERLSAAVDRVSHSVERYFEAHPVGAVVTVVASAAFVTAGLTSAIVSRSREPESARTASERAGRAYRWLSDGRGGRQEDADGECETGHIDSMGWIAACDGVWAVSLALRVRFKH